MKTCLFVFSLVVIFATSAFGLEIYIISKTSGEIISSGRLDKDWDDTHRDGSTALERIEKQLAEDSNLKVYYFPNQSLPNPEIQKIENDRIVGKSLPELESQKQIEEREMKIQAEIQKLTREQAIQSLIDSGDITP